MNFLAYESETLAIVLILKLEGYHDPNAFLHQLE